MAQTDHERRFSSQILTEGKFTGLFAGWGVTRVIALKASKDGELQAIADTDGEIKEESLGENKLHGDAHAVKLGPMFSTAIAGCDLMSSGLYTAGICANSSGKVRFANV